MSKHTLGPWVLDKNVGDTGIFRITDNRGEVVCIMARYRGAEVNAKLMTAAPDLLETLKAIAGCKITRELENKIYTAIAKAEG